LNVSFPVSWSIWTIEEVIEQLPRYCREIVERIDDFHDEHREKNLRAVAGLSERSPTPDEVRDGIRRGEIATVAFALDVLGRRSARRDEHDVAVDMFGGAHEFFRQGNAAMRASRPMQQTVGNALQSLVPLGMAEVIQQRMNLGELRDHLVSFVASAWGNTPPQYLLSIDEKLLDAVETARTAMEAEPVEHTEFVRANVEHVLALDAPSRLMRIRDHWHWLGQDMAPTATFRAVSVIQRPTELASLLPEDTWEALKSATNSGQLSAVAEALAPREEALIANLKLRLGDELVYREPATELRFRNQTDRFFEEAKGLLLRGDPRALDKFRNIHFHRRTHTAAKEWYAYALSRYGRPTDIYEIIHLLQGTINSPYFRMARGWTAHWNLASALRRVPTREAEALDVLLPVLDNVEHPGEALDMCLLWAFEGDREKVLDDLFLRSRYHESHLLAALRDGRSERELTERRLLAHLRRLSRIIEDPTHNFADPREELSFSDLDRLTRQCIEAGRVEAGVEWFRQRLSYGTARRMFKNWECAARLNEEAGDLPASWTCRVRQWECTRRQRGLDPRRKGAALRNLLAWSQKNGFGGEGRSVLAEGWRHTSMEEADVLLWEERLGTPPSARAGDAGGSLNELQITLPDELGVELQRPEAGDSYRSRILVELCNGDSRPLPPLTLQAFADEPGLMFPGAVTPVPALEPGKRVIIEVPVEVMAGGGDQVRIRLKLRPEQRGSRPLEQPAVVKLVSGWSPPAASLRTMTTGPIPSVEGTLFVGREEELVALRDAIAGGTLRVLRWIHGPPRIGKSSLLRRAGTDLANAETVILDFGSLPSTRSFTSPQAVRRLCRSIARDFGSRADLPEMELPLPGPAEFDLDPAWTVFEDFLLLLLKQSGAERLVLAMDGVDTMVRRAADPEDELDDSFLHWLRDLVEARQPLLPVCAANEPFDTTRARLPNQPLWADVRPLALGALSRKDVAALAVEPVRGDGIRWLPSAREGLWALTDGHPWLTQWALSSVIDAIGRERRRVVGPGDVHRVAASMESDPRVEQLRVAEAAYDEAEAPPDSDPSVDDIEIIVSDDGMPAIQGEVATPPEVPVALMVDWENVKISLIKALDHQPTHRLGTLRELLDPEALALRLVDLAGSHGVVKQRWAVAAWDRPSFMGDQRAVKTARFWTDIAGDHKADAADHVLREKIHYVLRDHPSIKVFIIATGDADFSAVVGTLLGEGKKVILWSARDALAASYKRFLGEDGLTLQWLDDLVFGEDALTSGTWKIVTLD
jgi:hypothetical protein